MGTMGKSRLERFCIRILLALLAASFCGASVLAADFSGSIRLVCRGKSADQAIPLAGDQYALVRVADGTVDADAGTVRYTTCEAFTAYDCDWAGLRASESRELAGILAETVMKSGAYERLGTTDQDGMVTFSELTAGLYLLIRVRTAPDNAGYLFDPCFQQVPQLINGEFVYQIETSPKYVTEKPELPPSLPQTGQLNWPVPVLLASGIICFLTGMEMSFGRRKTEDAE